jgi:hypothetical protein
MRGVCCALHSEPSVSGNSSLEIALDRLRIPDLWQLLHLEGKPGKSCRSPFRKDRHPSFSVFHDNRKFKDFTTGEGGDAADFLALARGLSLKDACVELIRLAGIPVKHEVSKKSKSCDQTEEERKAKQRENWPQFDPPSIREIETIAKLRTLSAEGVSLAADRGLLFTADTPEGRAWIISDSRRQNAQARRMDGGHWEHIRSKKAWTLPGSIGALPIGLYEALDFPNIVFVEGGPDLLAAFHLAWCATSTPETLALGKGVDVVGKLGVVAMLGSHSIPEGELRHFRGKRVRIFADTDEPRANGGTNSNGPAQPLMVIHSRISSGSTGNSSRTSMTSRSSMLINGKPSGKSLRERSCFQLRKQNDLTSQNQAVTSMDRG